MKQSKIAKKIALRKAERVFSSNSVRLSFKEIILSAFIVIILVYVIIPRTWKKFQDLNADEVNFRLAEKYRDDYWLYESWVDKASLKFPVLFLGDSVVWGMYVDNANTLPAFINRKLGRDIVGNISIDGLHPVAMEGLVDYYCNAIRNKKILLHYNPLWMNSGKYDLSVKSDFNPHHPRLLPQFSDSLEYNSGEFSDKMAVLRERHISFYRLLNHIRLSFFDNENFSTWIVDNYDDNFFSKLSLNVDACQRYKDNYTANWKDQGIPDQNWNWVNVKESNQWKAFERIIDKLEKRGNEICVMVGPINPHIMSPSSLEQFRSLQNNISSKLSSRGLKHFLAADMPSEYYADASHPLVKGYEMLAGQVVESQFFQKLREKNE